MRASNSTQVYGFDVGSMVEVESAAVATGVSPKFLRCPLRLPEAQRSLVIYLKCTLPFTIRVPSANAMFPVSYECKGERR